MREYSEHIARRAAIGVLVAAGVIAAATVALLFVFALAARPAHAQTSSTPPCWPAPLGAGSQAVIKVNGNGMAVAWACGQSRAGFFGRWTLDFDAGYQQQIPALIAGGPDAWAALWMQRVTRPVSDPALDVVRPLWNAALAEVQLQAPPPADAWVVAPNLTRPDRPTFAWVNGQRATSAAVERAPVGAPCDPKVGRTETGGSYFGVIGRADRVALCRKQ